MEDESGRGPLDPFGPSTRQRIAILKNEISRHNCMQLCAGRLHPQSVLSQKKKEKDFIRKTPRLGLRRRLYAKVIGNRSSSSSQMHWKVQVQQASGIRCEVFNHQPQQVVSTQAFVRKPLRTGFEPTEAREETEFEVDLRIEGIAQDAILKDEDRVGRTTEVGCKVKIGYCPKTKSNRFDEEESQKIYEQGNSELHELTLLCNSCLKHLPEKLIF